MLKKAYRLKNPRAFDATYRQHHVSADKYLILYAGRERTENSAEVKTGFAVSKKYHKRAVKRNRIKRLLRECCRLLIKTGQYQYKYQSLIFIPKAAALEANFSTIQNSVNFLLNKI